MPDDATFAFEKSARRDVRWWMLLIVGVVFYLVGTSIDPAMNCSEDGECAPWLVPLAAGAGVLAMLGGGAMLIANPCRGSRVDPVTGRLHWWRWRRKPSDPADEGSVAIADIAVIKVVNTSDSDHVHCFDKSGHRLPVPDSEVMPWPYEDWAKQLAAIYPHIAVQITP
jgi:hypothetical protein